MNTPSNDDSPGPREPRIWGRSVERDVDDELRFHLEERTRDLEQAGLDPAAARAAAAGRFGDLGRIRAECRTINRRADRAAWYARLAGDFVTDIRMAWRTLVRAPLVSGVVISVLALAVGANTAIFSVVRAVLLKPLPYREPGALVLLWSTGDNREHDTLTPARFLDYRRRATTLEGLAGISHVPLTLTGQGDPARLLGSSVSRNFFEVLGVAPLVGRTFAGLPDGSHAVVLGHRLWRQRFASDPAIVGSTLVLNDIGHTVVGVMPPDFVWPIIVSSGGVGLGPDLWTVALYGDVPNLPSNTSQEITTNRTMGYLRAVGRLKPGVSRERAGEDVRALAAALAQEHPATEAGHGAALVPLEDALTVGVRTPLLVLSAAVVLVLALACANIASLLLGRALTRERDMSLRLTLGAGRGRLVRQLLTESLVLAALGGVLGVLLAQALTTALVASSPIEVLRLDGSRIDVAVLLVTAAVTGFTGMLFGIAPALHLARRPGADSLRDGVRVTGSRGRRHLRSVLAAVQIAASVVLLAAAGLLGRSLVSLRQVDLGLNPANLVTFEIFLTGTRAEYQAQQVAFYEDLRARFAALPGVVDAGLAATLPIGGDNWGSGFEIEGQPSPEPGHEPAAGFQIASPHYFATMGIPVLAGRDFSTADRRDGLPVAIVNRHFALAQWGGVPSAIGKRLRVGSGIRTGLWITVVGVAGDVRHLGPAEPPRPEIFLPYTQQSIPFMVVVVRTDRDPAQVIPTLRAAMRELDPVQPLANLDTMEGHLVRRHGEARFLSLVVGAFALLALVLAAVGLYGTLAQTVEHRTREIGVRIALGAQPRAVSALVVSSAGTIIAAGLSLGALGIWGAGRVLRGVLFAVPPYDPGTLATTLVVLTGVAAMATALPIWRALHVDPVETLRIDA